MNEALGPYTDESLKNLKYVSNEPKNLYKQNIPRMNKALIIIDLQYDFCDGGPMANANSLIIIPKINSIRDDYNLVIFIKKTHSHDNSSFKGFGGSIPLHCIVNTYGSQLHSDLIVNSFDVTINYCNSNSAFYDDQDKETLTQLKYILQVNKIEKLYFCGNNMETSIFSTVFDAINYGFRCFIISDMIGYIDSNKQQNRARFLSTMDVEFVQKS
jgi:nicotinamidase/pyrazinamidase